jgi:hypothetical protein
MVSAVCSTSSDPPISDDVGLWVDIEDPGFEFYNVSYDRFYMSPNGFIDFGENNTVRANGSSSHHIICYC